MPEIIRNIIKSINRTTGVVKMVQKVLRDYNTSDHQVQPEVLKLYIDSFILSLGICCDTLNVSSKDRSILSQWVKPIFLAYCVKIVRKNLVDPFGNAERLLKDHVNHGKNWTEVKKLKVGETTIKHKGRASILSQYGLNKVRNYNDIALAIHKGA